MWDSLLSQAKYDGVIKLLRDRIVELFGFELNRNLCMGLFSSTEVTIVMNGFRCITEKAFFRMHTPCEFGLQIRLQADVYVGMVNGIFLYIQKRMTLHS